MDPGAVLEALLGHPNLGSRAWVTTQYDQTVGTDTIEGCEHGGGGAARQGHAQGARDRDRLASGGRRTTTRRWARALAVAECARNVASPAHGRWALTNCLNFGDPNEPEAYWQLARVGARPGRSGAARSACRSPAATSACTTSRRSAASCPPRRSASWACSTTSTTSSGRSSPTAGRPRRAARRDRPGHGRLGLRAPGGRRAGRPAAVARSGARGRAAGAPARGCRGSRAQVRPGRQRRRPRGGRCGVRHLVRPGRRPAAPGSARAGRRPFRREPQPGDRHHRRATTGTRSHDWRPAGASLLDAWASSVAIGCASASSASARPGRPRSAAQASRTSSMSRSTSCAARGRRPCRASWAQVA